MSQDVTLMTSQEVYTVFSKHKPVCSWLYVKSQYAIILGESLIYKICKPRAGKIIKGEEAETILNYKFALTPHLK